MVTAASDFRHKGLAFVGTKPYSQYGKRSVDLIANAIAISAGIVSVEVFMNVKDQVVRGTIRVGHFQQSRPGAFRKGCCACVVVSCQSVSRDLLIKIGKGKLPGRRMV